MNIPDKALEAAAIDIWETRNPELWEDADSSAQAEFLNDAKIALMAAAPFIRAEALREFAAQVVHDDPDDDRWRWETSDVADAARAYARELDPS